MLAGARPTQSRLKSHKSRAARLHLIRVQPISAKYLILEDACEGPHSSKVISRSSLEQLDLREAEPLNWRALVLPLSLVALPSLLENANEVTGDH